MAFLVRERRYAARSCIIPLGGGEEGFMSQYTVVVLRDGAEVLRADVPAEVAEVVEEAARPPEEVAAATHVEEEVVAEVPPGDEPVPPEEPPAAEEPAHGEEAVSAEGPAAPAEQKPE